MPPQEDTALLLHNRHPKDGGGEFGHHLSFGGGDDGGGDDSSPGGVRRLSLLNDARRRVGRKKKLAAVAGIAGLLGLAAVVAMLCSDPYRRYYVGPYRLAERHVGRHFFDYYEFLDGPDSLGSAGYNTYVGERRAMQLGIVNVSTDDGSVYIGSSAATTGTTGFRESVRLEGKRLFQSQRGGLFVLDVDKIPTGCGVWPAFWLTREKNWPAGGEIDVVEGINTQSVAKTALHTSEDCDMYAHVSDEWFSGQWDRSTGLYDTFTGQPDFDTNVPADNCWNEAPHRWGNQGCVIQAGPTHDSVNGNNATTTTTTSSSNKKTSPATGQGTLGRPVNDAGGAYYVLEWDPSVSRSIKSWVFRKDGEVPQNLLDSIGVQSGGSVTSSSSTTAVVNATTWNAAPYAYFAVGDGTGCSADHFDQMHLVINLAFCGAVAGNRFAKDCPDLAQQFAVYAKKEDGTPTKQIDPVATCNAYIASNPSILDDEAYWKINGVYVFERSRR